MNRLRCTLLLILVALFAFWLRVDAASWGLPFRLHPDEWKYVRGAADVHFGKWNPKYFRNPPGYSYLNAAWFPLWLRVAPKTPVPDWFPVQPESRAQYTSVTQAFFYRPFDLVLGVRMMSALFGAMTALLAFWICRELALGQKTALAAALLCAVSFANVRESHFAVNDAPMAFLATLSVAVTLAALRKNSLRLYYASAAVAGCAVAFKYSAFPAVIAIGAMRLLPFAGRSGFFKEYTRVIRDVALVGVISVAVFLLICPFPVIDNPVFMDEMRKLSDASAQGWSGQEKTWSGFLFAESLWISEGVFSLLLAVFGAYVFIKQKRWEVFLFPLAYALMVCSSKLYFMRFSLPFLPWVAVFAAAGISALVARIPQVKMKYAAASALVVLALLPPLYRDLCSNALLKKTDTRVELVCWLVTENHAREGVAGDLFCAPLNYWDTAEPWSLPLAINIDRLPSDQLRQLDQFNGFLAVSTFAAFPGNIGDTYDERRQALMQYANADAPVVTFHAFKDHSETLQAADVEDSYSPVGDFMNRERPGPSIEVFKSQGRTNN